jgi:hypothetical protein
VQRLQSRHRLALAELEVAEETVRRALGLSIEVAGGVMGRLEAIRQVLEGED